MTDISRAAVDALCETHAGYFQHGTAATLQALRAALDEAEANINLKADFIDETINQLEAMEQRATEAEARAEKAENSLSDCRARLDWANHCTKKAEAERDAAISAARIAYAALWELNLDNYDHDEVCKVNNGSVEAILTLAPIIGETHGKPPEWWAERAHLGAKP